MSGCPDIMRRQRLWREVYAALEREGFTVLRAVMNKHLRVWVRSREGGEGAITCASSPKNADHEPHLAVQAARRATRPGNRDARVRE